MYRMFVSSIRENTTSTITIAFLYVAKKKYINIQITRTHTHTYHTQTHTCMCFLLYKHYVGIRPIKPTTHRSRRTSISNICNYITRHVKRKKKTGRNVELTRCVFATRYRNTVHIVTYEECKKKK